MKKKNETNNDNVNNNDITDDVYGSYYDDPTPNTPPSELSKDVYNSKNVVNNQTKEFVDPNVRTSKIYHFILGILVIAGLLGVGYYFISEQLVPYEIKVNLTSLGLVQTKIKSSNYQISYLINPESKKVPKFRVTPSGIITINETTSNIASSSVGEATVEVLDINDNKTVRNVFKVYVVDKEIPIEDFTFNNISLKVGAKDIITITPEPSNTTDISFTYKSGDETIASVTNEGIVQGLSKGSTTITITNKKIVKVLNIFVN